MQTVKTRNEEPQEIQINATFIENQVNATAPVKITVKIESITW